LTALPRHYAAARGSYASEVAAAAGDFANSFRQSRLWSVLAWNDILAKYRGSGLGPFWITISQAAFVAGIAIVYADLFHVPTAKYVPWMATGVVIWNLVSIMIMEGAEAFVQGAQIIRQTAIPLPLFIWRVVFRNILTFAHQIVVIFVVALWFGYLLKINLPMAVLGFILVVLNIGWVSFFAAIVSARFRDVQQVFATVLQLLFFVSPVIWIPAETSKSSLREALLQLNPVSHLLAVMRDPLLGTPTPLKSVAALIGLSVVGWLFTFGLYAAVRRRIVHYL
jgi:ABC-type polysaccharide/polyol phosphate export permease